MNRSKLESHLSTLFVLGLLLATIPARALAVGGCVDSPEEPTLALGLLGITASAITYYRARFRRK